MRNWFLILLVTASASGLAAQVTPGLAISTVVHEPTAADVGTYIAGLQVPNPFYDPLKPDGQPEFNTAYGSGGGLSNELDSINGTFYALAGTTTHDLAVLLNTTGAPITIDMTTIQLAAERPAKDVATAPEGSSPDGGKIQVIYGVDLVSVTVADGASLPIFLINTKWRNQLDTSPRDYIWTFTFDDIGGTTYTVEAPLTVPKVGGDVGSGCVTSGNDYPSGLWLVATGGLAALVTRRKLLQKVKA